MLATSVTIELSMLDDLVCFACFDQGAYSGAVGQTPLLSLCDAESEDNGDDDTGPRGEQGYSCTLPTLDARASSDRHSVLSDRQWRRVWPSACRKKYALTDEWRRCT